MSYTTRCPACGTMFKVVPDQLKISDGWVRCGHCADVFDATLNLETWESPAPAMVAHPEVARAPEPPPTAESSLVQKASVRTVLATPVFLAGDDRSLEVRPPHSAVSVSANKESVPLPWHAPTITGPAKVEPEFAASDQADKDDRLVPTGGVLDSRGQQVPAQTGWQAPASTTGSEFASAVEESMALSQTELGSKHPVLETGVPGRPVFEMAEKESPREREPESPAGMEGFAAASSETVQAIHTDASFERGVESAAVARTDDAMAVQIDEPEFVRQAKQRAFWHSPGVRAVLGVLAVLLALLLGAQWAIHERDRLAASHPELGQLLARLCEPLGCVIGPLRRIDAVVIDSSTLARRLGDFYSFDLVLKNTADMPVAMPALELSLTDTRDSVIARRVFLPQELPGQPRLVPAQGNLALNLSLSIAEGGAVPMAGYRALVFYP